MPSFDIISKVDPQQLDNAVNSSRREIDTRYDLRGTNSTVEFDRKALALTISTEDSMKLDAVESIVLTRMTKQGVEATALDLSKEIQPSGKLLKKTIPIKQGIDRDTAKKIVKAIKDAKMKVQPQIMDDMVRVTGKKIDELQEAISLCKKTDFGLPLQYENMK